MDKIVELLNSLDIYATTTQLHIVAGNVKIFRDGRHVKYDRLLAELETLQKLCLQVTIAGADMGLSPACVQAEIDEIEAITHKKVISVLLSYRQNVYRFDEFSAVRFNRRWIYEIAIFGDVCRVNQQTNCYEDVVKLLEILKEFDD